MDGTRSRGHTPVQVTLAWGVHLFTAAGGVVGTLALISILRGELAQAALLMLAGLFIDSVDGTMARRVGVSEVLPDIDGRRLDDIVDYLNYAVVPAVFMLAAGNLPGWMWAAIPPLTSAYGFSQEQAKTPDDFFLGWPSYWNVLALYLWLLDLSPGMGAAWVSLCGIAIFVPLKYIYPSKLRVLKRTTAALGMLWGGVTIVAILAPAWSQGLFLAEISLGYVIYYLALSLWLGRRRSAAT